MLLHTLGEMASTSAAVRYLQRGRASSSSARHFCQISVPEASFRPSMKRSIFSLLMPAHVEDKAVLPAQGELLGQQVEEEPGLYVLIKGLLHGELGAPLAVVALVLGEDAGLRDVQVLAVDYLHGLELEHAAAADVGRGDVLRELGVRARRGADGGLEETAHEGRGAQSAVAAGAVELLAAEDGAALLPLAEDPVQQVPEGDTVHTVAHFTCLLYIHKIILSR